jgi:hypothetical protein
MMLVVVLVRAVMARLRVGAGDAERQGQRCGRKQSRHRHGASLL